MLLLAATLWLITAPVIALAAFATDLVRRQRYATLRLWAFVGAYLWGELYGLTLLFAAWVGAGFGTKREKLQRSAYEVQRKWLRTLWQATARIYSLELRVERPSDLPRGPFVVLVRHTSMIDTMIPGVFLGADYKLRLRYVLKRELLWDPCLDVGGHWMPNHFVDRSGRDRKRELRAMRALAQGMGSDEGVLVYPEGTRFSDERRRRALERLATEDRELHGLALRCHHTLPPRPGGTLALLNGSPEADVLIVAHAGFLGLTSARDLWAGTVTGRRISIRISHIPREQIPREADARVRWLFDRWARLDTWVANRETRTTVTRNSINSRPRDSARPSRPRDAPASSRPRTPSRPRDRSA